jgi:DNA polymerase III psi subunit
MVGDDLMPTRSAKLTPEQLAMREYDAKLAAWRADKEAKRQAAIAAFNASPEGKTAARNQAAARNRESVQNVVAPGNIWQRIAQLLGQ